MIRSVAYCLLDLGHAEYPPHIFFGTNDVTYSNTTVIVGQQINLSCTNFGGLAMSNFNWSVPGTTESQFYVSGDPLWTNGYPIPLTVTNTNTVSFFWVDTGTNTVTCTAVCGGATNTVTTTFNVLRPVPSVSTNTGSVTITADRRGDLWLDFRQGYQCCHNRGVVFLQMPDGFSNYEHRVGSGNYFTQPHNPDYEHWGRRHATY